MVIDTIYIRWQLVLQIWHDCKSSVTFFIPIWLYFTTCCGARETWVRIQFPAKCAEDLFPCGFEFAPVHFTVKQYEYSDYAGVGRCVSKSPSHCLRHLQQPHDWSQQTNPLAQIPSGQNIIVNDYYLGHQIAINFQFQAKWSLQSTYLLYGVTALHTLYSTLYVARIIGDPTSSKIM